MVPDFLIVGAGSAGCVIARRLIDQGHTVVLVEAGSSTPSEQVRSLSDAGQLWHSAEDWDVFTVPQSHCSGRRLHLPRGKVVGGSHALNAGIWVLGAKTDYQVWEYLGCTGWGWDEVLPYFNRAENYDADSPRERGREGLLDVSSQYAANPIHHSILEAAVDAGFSKNDDYNSGDPAGVSRTQLTIRNQERLSTWEAYLKPIYPHPDLTLISDGVVQSLEIAGNTVTGVRLKVQGAEQTIRAQSVVLCAGAIGSPEILLRSGIGPAPELSELGIKVHADIPGVGKNLQDHLLVPIIYSTSRPVPESRIAVAQTHLFAKSDPRLPVPDTQPIFFSVPMYIEGYAGGEMTGPQNGFSLMAGLIRPQSRGELVLAEGQQGLEVRVDLKALSVEADLQALLASVRHCRAIGQAEALAEGWGAEEIWPGAHVQGEALEQYIRDAVVTYHHQSGTCAMGQGESAVVSPETLLVKGFANLRIADASIMPLIPSGNTNAPTIMIAEKAADLILTQAS